jgi:hypothetical protein
MTWTNQLVTGLAELIAGAGLGTWRETGVYTDAETGITIAVVPATPDRIICLTPYPIEDGPLTAGITAVQLRCRAGRDPRDVQAMADELRDLLHNRQHTTVGDIHCELIWRQSQAWIGLDSADRQEITANYYVRAANPSAHLDD